MYGEERLLHARSQRPSDRCATEKRDEFPPPHGLTLPGRGSISQYNNSRRGLVEMLMDVSWSEKFAGLVPLNLIAPEPRHAHRRAEFP
jgi:hypothetical protein